MQIWISTKEAIAAIGISKQAFHKARAQRKFRSRLSNDNGGIQYEVLLTDLPTDIQAAYWKQKNIARDQQSTKMTDDEIYATAPEYARRKADKYLALIKQTEGLCGDALKTFIGRFNQANPTERTSYPRLLDARKRYQEQGISALLGQWGKRTDSIPDEWFAFYKSLYMVEGRPSVMSCWKITMGHIKELGGDVSNFPSAAAFDRKLKKEVPEQSVFTARHGAAAANRRYGFYIKRNYDDILSGECWVSDHAQVDVAVVCKEHGREKVVFPWVTVWRDFKSGKWLGWDLHAEGPNSDHIFQSFYRAAVQHGIPSYIYLDNGKDYRSKDFAGGRNNHRLDIDEKRTSSLTSALGITAIFAWPYNAQSKPIERDFLRNKAWFSQHNIGYRGGNVVERPEGLNDKIAAGKLMTLEALDGILTSFIQDISNQSVVSKGHRQGKSPDEIWTEEYQIAIQRGLVRFITKQALMLFCCRTSSVMSIGRRGVRDAELGVDYYGDWMDGQKGRKVYLRRDPKHMEEAWVFDAKTNDYLNQAYLLRETPALARTDVQKRELKQMIAVKRASNRIHKIFASTDADNITFEQRMAALATATRVVNEQRQYIPQGKPSCCPPVSATEMDRVIATRTKREKEGTQDISILGIHRQKKEDEKKRVLYTWESERDAAAAGA